MIGQYCHIISYFKEHLELSKGQDVRSWPKLNSSGLCSFDLHEINLTIAQRENDKLDIVGLEVRPLKGFLHSLPLALVEWNVMLGITFGLGPLRYNPAHDIM